MAGTASIENGRLGGRPKGRKNHKTIEREASQRAYEQWVLDKLNPIFQAQLLAALGNVFIYRKDHHGTGASKRIEHVRLSEPMEIADALDKIANNENGFSGDDGYCYVMTEGPNTRAIDSMLDRSIGKAVTPMDFRIKELPAPIASLDDLRNNGVQEDKKAE